MNENLRGFQRKRYLYQFRTWTGIWQPRNQRYRSNRTYRMRDNTAAQWSLRFISELDTFIVIYRTVRKVWGEIQGQVGWRRSANGWKRAILRACTGIDGCENIITSLGWFRYKPNLKIKRKRFWLSDGCVSHTSFRFWATLIKML